MRVWMICLLVAFLACSFVGISLAGNNDVGALPDVVAPSDAEAAQNAGIMSGGGSGSLGGSGWTTAYHAPVIRRYAGYGSQGGMGYSHSHGSYHSESYGSSGSSMSRARWTPVRNGMSLIGTWRSRMQAVGCN